MGYLRSRAKPDVRMIGTSDTLLATAMISGVARDASGKLTIEYAGETDICYDSQETKTRNGQTVFIGSDGAEYLESECELIEE
jgi:hypothetical protein